MPIPNIFETKLAYKRSNIVYSDNSLTAFLVACNNAETAEKENSLIPSATIPPISPAPVESNPCCYQDYCGCRQLGLTNRSDILIPRSVI